MSRISPALSAAASLLLLLATADPAPAGAQEASRGAPAGAGAADAASPTAIVIHGGAGSIREIDMTDEEERAYRTAMEEALEAGDRVLEEGGSSVDACVEAIQVMEGSRRFNAGVGAVFTSEGTVEHDASIMDGRTLNAGAVAGTKHIRSPIAAARLVMDSSKHVMLAQEGAETFAEQHGFEMVPNETFYTEERKQQWQRRQREEKAASASGPRPERSPRAAGATPPPASTGAGARPVFGPDHLGTVGCAALDRDGDLAAGTSTGGISNKRFGRIGDSPVIGAGTYADNETAAISATGHGEDFIRLAVAHDIVSMMRYAGLSLTSAANAVIHGRLETLGPQARGGIIGLDADGDVVVTFNTPGMFRAWIDADGDRGIEFYRE